MKTGLNYQLTLSLIGKSAAISRLKDPIPQLACMYGNRKAQRLH